MSLKRGLFYTLLAQLPMLVLFFAGSTFMTRLLAEEGRGIYALFQNQIVLFSLLLGLNLNLGITFFIPRTDFPRKDVLGVALSLVVACGVVFPFLIWGAVTLDRDHGLVFPEGYTGLMYCGYLYLSVMLGLLGTVLTSVFLGLKRFKALNQVNILTSALSAGFFGAIYWYTDALGAMNIPLVFISTLAMQLITVLIWCVLYVQEIGYLPPLVLKGPALTAMVRFSVVGLAANIIQTINYRFDVWVVQEYSGVSELGLYAVAVGLAQLFFYIPTSFSRVMQPFLFGSDGTTMREKFLSLSRMNTTSVLVGCVLLGAIASTAIPLLFGVNFYGSISPLLILLPGIVFASAWKFLAVYVIHMQQQRFTLLASFVGAIVTIGLDLLLIPIWGINGAALATTISYLTTLLVTCFYLWRRMDLNVWHAFLIKSSDIKLLDQVTRGRLKRP